MRGGTRQSALVMIALCGLVSDPRDLLSLHDLLTVEGRSGIEARGVGVGGGYCCVRLVPVEEHLALNRGPVELVEGEYTRRGAS